MKCTGKRCPMQHPFDTEKCEQTDCMYRTEPMTNEDIAKIFFKILGDMSLDRLREICEADRDGRCVVLPCQIGTPVWSSCFTNIDKTGAEHATGPWDFSIMMMDEWGKSWHLKEEDAEAALKGEQDG